MSDTMMFGIATMPYEVAMKDELSRRQFYANTQRLVAALEAAQAEVERLRQALEPWANEPDIDAATMLRLIKTIKYLVGIAERGEGRKIADDETPEQFVLGYVKRLEQANQDASADLREKNGVRA